MSKNDSKINKLANKKKIIIISLLFCVFILIIIGIILNKAPITYDKEYIYDDSYYIFYKNGTCERATSSGKFDGTCTYEIKDKDIIVTSIQQYLGTDIDTVMSFHIKDKKTLEHYMTSILGNKFNGDYGNIWSINGKLKNKDNDSKNEQIENTKEDKPYYQKYDLIKLNNGSSATITFYSNNICTIDFSAFNNRQYTTNYMQAAYSNGTCKYTTTNDKDFAIEYDGILEITYHWYHDYYKQMQTTTMGSMYTMKRAEITFNDNYSSFTFNNGKFTGQTGEIYYYYFATNDSEEVSENENVNDDPLVNDTPNNNSSNNSSNNGGNNNNNENESLQPPEKSDKEKSKEELDKIYVELKAENSGLYYNVMIYGSDASYSEKLTNNGRAEKYKIMINDQEYESEAVGYGPILSKRFETKVGENCFNITIEDTHQNQKSITKCYTFNPIEPKIKVRKDSQRMSDGYCAMDIRDTTDIYYNTQFDKCLIDGVESDCRYSVYVSPGIHTFKIFNKFGQSSETQYECILKQWGNGG